MHTPTGTLLRLAALMCTALLATSGCSDEPPRAGSIPSDTPSATSTSATPQTPEEQVEAAVRAYYAELTRAAQTNDTSKLKTMVTRGCPCYRPIQVIDKGAVRGETTPDAAWTITSVRVHDIESDSALANVRYRVSAYEVVGKNGEVIAKVEAQRSHYDLSLSRGPDGWVIGNLFNLEG